MPEQPKMTIQDKYNLILKLANTMQVISVIDLIFVLFFIGGELYFMLWMIIFPIIGFFAGRNISFSLACTFLIYLVLAWIVRWILAGVFNQTIIWILQIIAIIFGLLEIYYCVRYVLILKQMSLKEKEELLITKHGVGRWTNRNCDM